TAELRAKLEANNRNDGAGRLSDGEEALLVRSEGSVQSEDDLRAIVVTIKDGVPVRVGDVATVRTGSLTRYGVVTHDGKGEVVEGLVLGLAGANARTVVDGVEKKLAELAPSLPKGIRINVFYNRAALVTHAVTTVAQALLEATALVLILLGLFLGNVRAALTVALILPLAALATFILMRMLGMSANLMSLGGLAIAIGLVVDAAVVVVENVVRHLASDPAAGKLPRLHVIFRAVREVALPTVAGMGIIVIVFLPLLTLEGLEGKLFVPVALTIAFALSSSLILSLTVIPVLASYLLKEVAHGEPWLPRKLHERYVPILDRVLATPKPLLVVAGVLLVVAIGIYSIIGKTFMPTMDEGDVIVGIEKLPSVSLEQTAALDARIQAELMRRVPEITGAVGRAGSDELGLDPMGLNQTDTFLVLKPKHAWRDGGKEALLENIRGVLESLPVKYSFTQPIEMRISEMIVGVRGDVAIKVFGPDLATLNEIGERIAAVVADIHGSRDVYTAQNDGVQYLRVVIDRLAAGRFGLNVEDVQDALRIQVEGQRAGVVVDGNQRVPVIVRGPDLVKLSAAEFSALQIATPDGGRIPLVSVARLERSEGPVKIDREHGSRFGVVIANVGGRDLVGFVEEAKAKIAAAVTLPTGYRLSYGGQFENQQRASARLGLVVPLGLVLIFVILFSVFGSLRQALLVLSNIPFALVGGTVALWIAGEYLSVPASVGFIALLGIAVLNGVVLVSCFNQLHDEGLSLIECVRQGAQRRLRPVLMTASITAFGLIPLLFASGPGSEVQRPLAIVAIGGLITATALTLLILPVLYLRFGQPTREIQNV
ncbi:MAG: efflux RND transporter permease subunit, partial [Rhodanobacteraceae bacterium]